jgi:hypothetical protein
MGTAVEAAVAVEMTISFEWNTLGHVELDAQGKLVFPHVPTRPGLYRFEFEGEKVRREYIGETDTLNRRFQHYRTPGPTQRTNIRLNTLIREALSSHMTVGVSIVLDGATITMTGQERTAGLQNKSDRVLLEHAAIYAAREAGITILNGSEASVD